MYAQVLIFLPIRAKSSPLFDYAIPEKLSAEVRPGVLVVVPLRRRLLPGIVMGLTETPSVPDTRPIHSILDPEPALSDTLMDLARWMARETLTPLHKCVQAMLPPGMRPQAYLRLSPQLLEMPPDLPEPAEALMRLLLERGPLKSSQVSRALRNVDWQRARRYLEKRGYVKTERRLRLPRMQPKTVRVVRLAVPRAQWPEKLEGLRRTDLYLEVLAFLEAEEETVEASVVYAETDAQSYHLEMLESRDLVSFSRQEIIRDPLSERIFTPNTPLKLTAEQRAAWEEIAGLLAADAARPPVLLFGVTGSGKTEIYMRAAERVLEAGRQALVLVPEISLTPQTVRRFALRFPGKVGLWHSGISDGERFDTWRRVRSGELSIVVGARSALFAPFPDLGLVVLDEEESSSYKQGQMPYYHARETAEALAKATGALLILGSATPTLDAYARALEGRYRLVKMPRRVMGHLQRIGDWLRHLKLSISRYLPVEDDAEACTIELPPVEIVDMRAELQAGNRSIFSRALQQEVDRALGVEEQVILFLNRRGTATYVFCRDCGWVAECPRCDVPLTYHRGVDTLICHRCDHRRVMPRQCPECNSKRVRAFGLGTEGLESQVQERWPGSRIIRWDRDAARSHGAHTLLMNRFAEGDADILVGTQMIARGLDLPKVTVVGVISADTALNFPDFRAAERTFQLLAQVAGRAGRGILGGQVILQTYHPEHYAIERAAEHDYVGFATRELTFRRAAGYPPAIRMARLVYAHTNQSKARAAAQTFAATLREALHAEGLSESDVIGPAPAFFARVRGRYRWQILLRSVDPADFLRRVEIPAGWLVDVDPVSVL